MFQAIFPGSVIIVAVGMNKFTITFESAVYKGAFIYIALQLGLWFNCDQGIHFQSSTSHVLRVSHYLPNVPHTMHHL